MWKASFRAENEGGHDNRKSNGGKFKIFDAKMVEVANFKKLIL